MIDRLLKNRYLIYGLFLAAIVAWKLWPTIEPAIKGIQGVEKDSGGRIMVSGLDGAPQLVLAAVANFKTQYPKVEVSVNGGGTVAALEDLLNKRAEVAVLSRMPSKREQDIAVSHDDSLLCFPVALGGIRLLGRKDQGFGALSIDELRRSVLGGFAEVAGPKGALRVYGPDPNGGLWDVLLTRLELTGPIAPAYVPMPSGDAVVAAVRNDPAGIGFASDLTYDLPKDDPQLAEISLAFSPGDTMPASRANIVSGSYPLYHYVYLCTTNARGVLPAGFVTYYSQPTGQRWVARRGFLPAKVPAREIRLSGKTPS